MRGRQSTYSEFNFVTSNNQEQCNILCPNYGWNENLGPKITYGATILGMELLEIFGGVNIENEFGDRLG